MIFASKEIIYVILPFAITIPLYLAGRKLFFKQYKQSEMHTIKSGQFFTATIGILHIAMTIVLFFWLGWRFH